MTRKLIPAKRTRVAFRVANSRFIATAAPAFTVDQARAFIDEIKREFADATHNVSAYVIGHGASVVAHCTDDGEPSGTAGRPALAVLQGSGLGDVVVVVTRYFGGTKLGTGGLVRAYGDGVREVLDALPRAAKTSVHTIRVVAPYNFFEALRLLIQAHHGIILDEAFAADVTITARLMVEQFPAFQTALQERSSGQLKAEIVKADETAILPIR